MGTGKTGPSVSDSKLEPTDPEGHTHVRKDVPYSKIRLLMNHEETGKDKHFVTYK